MISKFNYQEELSKCGTMEDITDAKSKGNTPKRNGTSSKKVKTSYGSINIDISRVREGEFEPEVIKERAVIEEGLEAQIISMYAKGMMVRDTVSHVQAL